MIWHFLRYILSLTIPAFYRKIEIRNPEYIPTGKPAILSFNHPNAFTDPLGITFGIWPIRTWYMARGDVFKPGPISRILQNIGIVPIFRIQDAGKEGLLKNDDSYRLVFRLLRRKKKVIVFSEGICVQERRLRPIKKGVPRMLMAAWEEVRDPELCVIPVGLFYSRPDRFHSDWLFNIGKPVLLAPWYEQYKTEPARTLSLLRKHLEQVMKEQVIHIENPKWDKAAEQLEILYLNEFLWIHRLPDTPYSRFRLASQITASLNQLSASQQEAMQSLTTKLQDIFTYCRKHHLRPWMCDEYYFKRQGYVFYIRFLLLLMLIPVYLLASLLVFVPNVLSVFLTRKIVRSREFYSSFLIGIGSFMLLFWLTGISLFTAFFFKDTRYPVFFPLFIILMMLSGFWYKHHVNYIKIFSYLYRKKSKHLWTLKSRIHEAKKEWEALTNFKVA